MRRRWPGQGRPPQSYGRGSRWNRHGGGGYDDYGWRGGYNSYNGYGWRGGYNSYNGYNSYDDYDDSHDTITGKIVSKLSDMIPKKQEKAPRKVIRCDNVEYSEYAVAGSFRNLKTGKIITYSG